jgi:hypothetical protein
VLPQREALGHPPVKMQLHMTSSTALLGWFRIRQCRRALSRVVSATKRLGHPVNMTRTYLSISVGSILCLCYIETIAGSSRCTPV